MIYPIRLTRLLRALFLMGLLVSGPFLPLLPGQGLEATPVAAQTAPEHLTQSELARFQAFTSKFNDIYTDFTDLSNALHDADRMLSNTLWDGADTYGVLIDAREALKIANAGWVVLDARVRAIAPPQVAVPRFQTLIAELTELSEQVMASYNSEIQILIRRIALADSASPDMDLNAELDAMGARNTANFMALEIGFLAIAQEGLTPDHPQFWLNRLMMLGNEAYIPIIAAGGVGMIPEHQMDSYIRQLRSEVADMRQAVAEGVQAIDVWRTAEESQTLKDLANSYDAAFATEQGLAELTSDLAQAMALYAQTGIYEPVVFDTIDGDLAALITHRFAHVDDRNAIISDLACRPIIPTARAKSRQQKARTPLGCPPG